MSRSGVLFPQPDGPTSTRNSPSPTRRSTCAVEHGRVLEVARELAEEAGEEPYRERHREREVRKDQAGIGVEEAHLAQDQIEGRHDRDLRKHRHGKDDGKQRPFAAHAHPRQRVCAQRGHRDDHRRRQTAGTAWPRNSFAELWSQRRWRHQICGPPKDLCECPLPADETIRRISTER